MLDNNTIRLSISDILNCEKELFSKGDALFTEDELLSQLDPLSSEKSPLVGVDVIPKHNDPDCSTLFGDTYYQKDIGDRGALQRRFVEPLASPPAHDRFPTSLSPQVSSPQVTVPMSVPVTVHDPNSTTQATPIVLKQGTFLIQQPHANVVFQNVKTEPVLQNVVAPLVSAKADQPVMKTKLKSALEKAQINRYVTVQSAITPGIQIPADPSKQVSVIRLREATMNFPPHKHWKPPNIAIMLEATRKLWFEENVDIFIMFQLVIY